MSPVLNVMENNGNQLNFVSEQGVVKVPIGPGLGVDIDPEFIAKHKVLTVNF